MRNKIILFLTSAIFICFATFLIGKNENGYTPIIDTKFPILEISTTNEFTEKDFLDATSTLYNEDVKFQNKGVQIRLRGNLTYLQDKKPYKLKFYDEVDMLNDSANNSQEWVLLADYFDKSLIRNYTALSLAKAFSGLEYAVDFMFVELVLNDEHHGTYLLTEQVGVGVTMVDINEKNGDILFERVTEDRMKQEYNFDVLGIHRNVVYDIRSQVYNLAQIERSKNIIQTIEQALKDADEIALKQYIDINSCVDFYILQELMMNIDVGFGSGYMYIYANADKVYFGPAWDFDLSAGNDSRVVGYEGLYVGSTIDELTTVHAHDWYQQLMQFEWFIDSVKSRWVELSPEILEVLNDILNLSEIYNDEFQRNLTIWELDEFEYKDNFDEFYEWINNRFYWLDEYFK